MRFSIRFVFGGLLVALIPLVSRAASPRLAGVLILLPAITLLSFLFIGRDQGVSAVSKASGAAIYSLPAVLAFLVGVHLVARRDGDLVTALALGVLMWLVIAVPVSVLLLVNQ
jgi:uncharacterized membrane protein (GlpM family)